LLSFQLKPLNLSRGRPRQFIDEFYACRKLVRRKLRGQMRAQVSLDLLTGPILSDDCKGPGGCQPFPINARNYGGLKDRVVRQQCCLDFDRRDPQTLYFEAIVGAPNVIVVVSGIAPVDVAGSHPAIADHVCSQLRPVPVTGCRAFSAHPQTTGRLSHQLISFFVEQDGLVALDRYSARARALRAGWVRNEDGEHFARADAVEDGKAECSLPLLKYFRGQRFAGGYAQSQRRSCDAAARAELEQGPIDRRHAKEHSRRLLLQYSGDPFGCGTLGVKDHRGACGERERQANTAAGRKERYGGAGDPVGFG